MPSEGGRKPPNKRRGDPKAGLFPMLANTEARFGVGVVVAIAESAGRQRSIRIVRRAEFDRTPGRRPRERLLGTASLEAVARVCNGFGHTQRLRIARAILTGANTHLALRDAVGLSPGPLYHHIRSMERAGLVETVDRNRYDLTSVGRDLLLVTAVTLQLQARGRGGRSDGSRKQFGFPASAISVAGRPQAT